MGLSGFQLKVIAVIAMSLDHISAVWTHDIWMRIVGRMTMPIMCYFIAEGYYQTRNKKKYALRLFGFAVLSEVPFQMCFRQSGDNEGNVIWTLLLGMLALWAFDSLICRGKKFAVFYAWLSILPFCFLASHMPMVSFVFDKTREAGVFIGLTATDYSWIGVSAVVLAGCLHPKSALFSRYRARQPDGALQPLWEKSADIFSKWLPQIALTGFVYMDIWSGMAFSHMSFESKMLVFGPMMGSVLLTAYTGRRGCDRLWAKYLFYIYYPLHLLLIAWI